MRLYEVHFLNNVNKNWHLSAESVGKHAGIRRVTLRNIEKGSPSVAIGSYAAALHALNGMDKDLL